MATFLRDLVLRHYLYPFLGHRKSLQHLSNVPNDIQKIYIAEDFLEDLDYDKHETAFINYFKDSLPVKW